MENLFITFLGTAAFNIAAGLAVFAIAFTTLKKRYPISWLRAGAVLIGGWLLGSVIVFAVLSALGGLLFEDKAHLEIIVAMCVLLPTMFVLFNISRAKPTPTKPMERPNLYTPLPQINPEYDGPPINILRGPPQRPTTLSSSNSAAPEAKPRHYFVRHWLGDLSLGISYWINWGLIAGVIHLVLIAIVSEYVTQTESLRSHAQAYVLGVVAGVIPWVWGMVGSWRSSNKHVARGGRQGWASATKIMVILGIVGMTVQFGPYVPTLKEMGLIALGEDPIGGYKVTVLSDGKSILVRGVLREGAAREIEKLLDSAPAVNRLVLSSAGGRLFEGKQLAIAVKTRSLNTYVEDLCLSTCTFAFLAGKERAATPNAKIGFHMPSAPGSNPEMLRTGIQFMMNTYRQAGLPKEFLARVQETPGTSMWYPTMDELIEARVITRTSLGGETTIAFSTIRSKQEFLLALLKLPLLAAYQNRFPEFVNKIGDRAWVVKEQGGNDDQILNTMRAVTSEYYPRLLAQADDSSLESFTRIFVDQLKAARLISYDACVMLMEGQLDITTVLPKQLFEREKAWTIEALNSQGVTNRRTKQVTERAIQAVVSKMLPTFLDAVANPKNYQDQPGLLCDSTVALYDAALSLSSTQKAAALEGLLKGRI